MTDYELVAGIETHVQLKTESKLFCGCATRFGAPPNTQVCPVCLGHPGVLPAVNRRAFELALRAALALGCTIAERTKFDRKNYFYPDLPKNYQISQYDLPFSRDGYVEIIGRKRIGIIRVHMEEDAGKLIHEEKGNRSFVDLNRAGIPLIEIVTRPDLRSTEEAHSYLTALKQILQWIGVSDCDMEKGELRCDVNLSVRPRGETELGVKVEIKNLNSFRFAKDALAYEFERQKKAIEAGEKIVQETRLYDPERGVTQVMRTKEDAHDYRYFPEPDLPPIVVTRERIEDVRKSIPELPRLVVNRFMEKYELSEYDARVLTDAAPVARFFEECVKLGAPPKKVANWVSNELLKALNELKVEVADLKLRPAQLVELVDLVDKGEISGPVAKELLPELVRSPQSPRALVEARGLRQVADAAALEPIARKVCEENAKIAADFKGGKEAALQALIGRMMKATQGRANPKVAEEVLRRLLH